MATSTKIEWTGATWNPISGCTSISPGCAHCYARRMAKRLAGRCGYPAAPHEFDVTLHPDKIGDPLGWRKPRRVFVCSMSDLFHEDVPFEFIDQVFSVMARCPKHTFQVLTKRPERMKKFFDGWSGSPIPNIWLGVTAENQEQADKRIPALLRTPAAVRFVSVEPMLGPMNATRYLPGYAWQLPDGTWIMNSTTGRDSPPLDWVICGPETGPGARERERFPDRARDLCGQCVAAGVPFFLKKNVDGTRLLDGREWNEYPEVGDGD